MSVPSPSPRDSRLIGACADPPTAAKVTSLGCRASILLNAVRQVLAGPLEGSAELQANGQANNRRMPTNSSGAYFDLQLQFGERYAELTDVPLADAISKCTNLRRRFGLWGTSGDWAWAAFLKEVPYCAQHTDFLRLTLSAVGSAPAYPRSPFG